MFLLCSPPWVWGLPTGTFVYIIIFFYIISVALFAKVVLIDYLDCKVYEYIAITSILTFMSIQYLPYPAEGLFWYSGAVTQTFAYCINLLLSSSLLSFYRSDKKNQRIIYFGISIFFCLFVFLSEYVEPLMSYGFQFVLIYFSYKKNKDKLNWLLLIFILSTIAFAISALSPGTFARIQVTGNHNAIVAMLSSFDSSSSFIIRYMKLYVVLALIFLIPFINNIIIKLNFRFKYPGVVFCLSYVIFTFQWFPVHYGYGNYIPDRMKDIYYLRFWIFLIFNEFYFWGWINFKSIKFGSGVKSHH